MKGRQVYVRLSLHFCSLNSTLATFLSFQENCTALCEELVTLPQHRALNSSDFYWRLVRKWPCRSDVLAAVNYYPLVDWEMLRVRYLDRG